MTYAHLCSFVRFRRQKFTMLCIVLQLLGKIQYVQSVFHTLNSPLDRMMLSKCHFQKFSGPISFKHSGVTSNWCRRRFCKSHVNIRLWAIEMIEGPDSPPPPASRAWAVSHSNYTYLIFVKKQWILGFHSCDAFSCAFDTGQHPTPVWESYLHRFLHLRRITPCR